MAEFAMKTSFGMVPRPLPVALGLLCLLAGPPLRVGAAEPAVPASAPAAAQVSSPAISAPGVASGATTGQSRGSGAASASVAGGASSSSSSPPPPGVPALWGYGMRPCSAFLASAPREGTPAPLGDSDYQGYREWLAGLVSGLNLATGRDVLKGAELDAALIRIRANCARDPEMDFFNASMRLIRGLGL